MIDRGASLQACFQTSIRRLTTPAHVIVDLLVGPLFYRMFVRHRPLNGAFVSRVFQTVISGLEKVD